MRFVVVGATSWGFSLASLLSRNCEVVNVVARSEGEAREIREAGGLARLPGFTLPENMSVTSSANVGHPDGIVVAVPAQSVRASMSGMPFDRTVPILSGAKGLETGTQKRVAEILQDLGWSNVAVLSGPNLAREVVQGLPAAAVVAARNYQVAAWWQSAFASPTFRTYRSTDVIGVEIAGALKNVVAIAAGAATGLGFGSNSVAAIMTRGLAEMTRLGTAMGGHPATFGGLAGVGDLAATCFSPLSRNHRFGALLARGLNSRQALEEIGEAVEGAVTALVAVAAGDRLQVEVPIATQVAAVVEGRATVMDAMANLLSRSLKSEDA